MLNQKEGLEREKSRTRKKLQNGEKIQRREKAQSDEKTPAREASQSRKESRLLGTVVACGRDMVKAFLIGLLAAAALGLLLFLGGFAVKGGKLLAGLEAAKDGLFLILAILLFLLAGMLLMKGKKQEEMQDREGWRRHFSVFGVKMVLACISIGFLLVATAADYLIWRIG